MMITMRPDGYSVRGVAEYVRRIAQGKTPLVMVEIGSYAGESMMQFAESRVFSKIVCIDPWKAGWDDKDPASRSVMAEVEKAFDARAAFAQQKYGVDVAKHRGTIDTFVESPDFSAIEGNVDFAYIDACHEYEFCKHDIDMCLAHLKPRLAISGHDYTLFWSGVVRAVNETFKKPSALFADQSWIVKLN